MTDDAAAEPAPGPPPWPDPPQEVWSFYGAADWARLDVPAQRSTYLAGQYQTGNQLFDAVYYAGVPVRHPTSADPDDYEMVQVAAWSWTHSPQYFRPHGYDNWRQFRVNIPAELFPAEWVIWPAVYWPAYDDANNPVLGDDGRIQLRMAAGPTYTPQWEYDTQNRVVRCYPVMAPLNALEIGAKQIRLRGDGGIDLPGMQIGPSTRLRGTEQLCLDGYLTPGSRGGLYLRIEHYGKLYYLGPLREDLP